MDTDSGKIAVIGMACRFPGARNVDEFWQNLVNGKETIKHFTDDELSSFEVNYDELRNNPNYVPARGIIEDIDKFDASFFGYTPNEAAITDPQHRVWLETTWDAFENAGCNPFTYKGAIGVFAGAFENTYLLNNVLRDSRRLENYIRLRSVESFQIMTNNNAAYLPTKTAYQYNLRGPAINVQTACSTSLVAIAQACQSLYSFESDVCLAGGVCILTPQESGYLYQDGAIPSPDGHCRPFDAKGQGTVFSNGVGVVVLKRLEDALIEKDNIIAIVDGWALNNDGYNKVSYTAPSVDGQSEVIIMAQAFANIPAEDIGYVEAHGTATRLGDPIEIAALTKAFKRSTDKKQFCGIGSVKSNIGHTDSAAGVASFIKICLAAKHKVIPPSLNFETPNPHIGLEETPFYVVDKRTNWERDKKLIMGVSSFGIGGTNAHVIVEEPPAFENRPLHNGTSKRYILPLSAKSEMALEERKSQIVDFVKENSYADIDDLAYTLWNGRDHMKYRSSIVVGRTQDLMNDAPLFTDGILNEKLTSLAFMFPGQGSQFFQMGKTLYDTNKTFRSLLNEGFQILKAETGINLKSLLFESDDVETSEMKLAETSITQPALFIIQYAMARILIDNDVNPSYLIGHSIGEYTAACLAEVFDFESTLKVVIKRGQLMQSMHPGKMYATRCSLEKLTKISNRVFEIAAQNAPENCTISFENDKTGKVKELLEANDIQYLPLNTSHAFHSRAFEPILSEFADFVSRFSPKIPNKPIISCLTGEFITPEQAVDSYYWAKQLRNSVLFYKGIKSILDKEQVVFVEVGPNSHLSSILRTIPEVEDKKSTVLTLGKPETKDLPLSMEIILGKIWTIYEKFTPKLDFISEEVRRIALPAYPFERKKYWIDFDIKTLKESNENSIISNNSATASRSNKTTESLSVKDKLLKIWKEVLGEEEIRLDLDFYEIGGNSLLALQILDRIKEQFKIRITFQEFLTDYSSIEKLAVRINTNDSSKKVKVSQKRRTTVFSKGTKTPFFMVYGDQVFIFENQYFGTNRPVYGFIWPGSDSEKMTARSVKEIATDYVKQIKEVWPNGPYLLGGFSFGGILAWEIATQLQNSGADVPKLVIIDAANPNILKHWIYEVFFRKDRLNIFKHNLKTFLIKTYGFIKGDLPPEFKRRLIINYSNNLAIKHIPSFYDGSVLLIKSTQNYLKEEFLGWETHTSEIKLQLMSGNHIDLIELPENREKNSILIREFLSGY